MFKWRIDRNSNRTKSLFKLNFRITQVPVLVGDALLVSVIPKDVGRPTSRLDKCFVDENGICCWEKPVYETVRFVRDLKTGKFSQKIYYFIVSTGNQKSNVVGEVLIDFADYAESIKPSSVSLPFKNTLCAAVLHITIQRMQEPAELRSFTECEDVAVKVEETSLNISLRDVEVDEKEISNSDQGTTQVRTTTTTENVESNENKQLPIRSEILSSPEQNSEEKIHQGHTSSLQSSPSCDSLTNKPDTKILALPNQQSFDGFSTDGSTFNSTTDVEIEKLKSDLVILARQSEFSGLELQALRKQIVKESKRGNELAREVINLKEEKDELKAECENLKAAQNHIDEAKEKNRWVRDLLVLIEELRQELQNEKNLNANLNLQLQKTQESNTELILAVQDLDEMLEQKNKDKPYLPHNTLCCEIVTDIPEFTSKCYIQEDEEQNALEELVNQHKDVEDANILEQKKDMGMYHEMEVCRRDRDNMELQMEQLALDYEILKQENQEMAYKLEQSQLQEQLKVQYECSYTSITELEGQIEGLENELRNQEKRYGDSLTMISELKDEVLYLEDELEKQVQGFEADLESVMSAKVDQEKRAILAEEALRVTKKKNVNTAERLLGDFKSLSEQMGAAFDQNEKLSVKSFNEAAELRQEKICMENLLHKAMEELNSLKKDYKAKLGGLSNQVESSLQHIDELKAEADYKINQLEAQILCEKEMNQELSQELLMLRDKIERLTEVNNVILQEKDTLKADLEQARTSTDEVEVLLIGRDVELSELEDTIALISEKADKSMEDLAITKSILKEKEKSLANVALELDDLKAQYNILKQTSSENESEKENLRTQVLQLKRDIEEKEDVIITAGKKLKKIIGYVAKTSATNVTQNGIESHSEPCDNNKDAACLLETISLLEGQIKMSQKSIEATVDSFLEKEKRLMDKIKELESSAEELNQTSNCSFDCQVHKEDTDDADNGKDSQVKMASNSNQNIPEMAAPQSDQSSNLNVIFGDMERLKERNTYMEMELKELQGRYSEISLKFAEVEGERQKLVMSVRYLKSSRRH